MNNYLLVTTAIFTLVLNLFLTMHLIKDKTNVYSYGGNKKEIINFVLTPSVQNEVAFETEVLSTEIISPSDNYHG
jgi:hypothetical protein